MLLPVWATVVFFALAMIGLAGWQTAWGTRIALTACIYVAAFSIVGQEFNRYWGLMIAPLFCFGAVRAPAALYDLWHAAKLDSSGSVGRALARLRGIFSRRWAKARPTAQFRSVGQDHP